MPNARNLLIAALLWFTPALAVADIVMHRDPGCGCCEKWAALVQTAFGKKVQIVDEADRTNLKRRLGVPASLHGCHTAIVDGMAFEGHVPIADMKRVLAARPAGVRGLAVTGMPAGSAGMEVPGMAGEHYNVVAFGNGRTFVFARH